MSISAHGLSPLGLPSPVVGCTCVVCKRGREALAKSRNEERS